MKCKLKLINVISQRTSALRGPAWRINEGYHDGGFQYNLSVIENLDHQPQTRSHYPGTKIQPGTQVLASLERLVTFGGYSIIDTPSTKSWVLVL